MTKLTEKLEVLAFGLYVRWAAVGADTTITDMDVLMQHWRSDTNVRQTWRREADILLDITKEAGVDIEAPAAPLRKFITKLITQPASVMYTLEDERVAAELEVAHGVDSSTKE